MKIDKDLSGFDEVDKWEDELWDTVADIGLDAVRFAKENGEYNGREQRIRYQSAIFTGWEVYCLAEHGT